MRLDHILKSTAKRMHAAGVSIEINSGFSWVTISCKGQDDIFMQGDDAEKFIDEVELIANKRCRGMDSDTIALALAEPYTECLWN